MVASADNPSVPEKPPAGLDSDALFAWFWERHFAAAHAAELALEEQYQQEAFLDATHTVAGFELRGMTPRDLLLLQGCDSPFVVGGRVDPAHIAQFLALLSVPAPRGWWSRRRFFARIRALPYGATVAAIDAYLKRIFSAGGAARSDSGSASAGTAPRISMCFLAPLVMQLAGKTGWPERDILDLRLDRLFQYRRALDYHEGGKLPLPSADRRISECCAMMDRYLATGELPPAS